MRVPQDSTPPLHQIRMRRPSMWLLIALGLLIVLLILGQWFAGFYTNFLWFRWSGMGVVWRTEIGTKLGLGAVFVAVAFALIWGCLYLVDKVAPRALFMAPDTELVRRFQSAVGPHAFALRTVVSLVVSLAVGTGASTQWQHWLLFEHAVPFGTVDPVFHRDASFFVFRLPFLSFLVDWMFIALIVAAIVSAVAYFLNGAIHLQGNPRIEPRALAHLSLLFGLMALERAWAFYFVDRFTLDVSSNGYVSGAGYTDVHVRLPAMTLLAVVSLVAFVMLVFNAYQRSLVLPSVAIGLWIFLAIVVGVIYPEAVQAFRVTPAQSTLEVPYIQKNIAATRVGMGITSAAVTTHTFPANEDLTVGVLQRYNQTLDDAQVWDPSFTLSTFQKLQLSKNYYAISNLYTDRYDIDNKLVPVVIGVRALNSSGIQSPTWVNTHLQYTHGYEAFVAPANGASSSGEPNFALGSVPPKSSVPALTLTQPGVYFAPGDSQYVIADSDQKEVDYQSPNGQNQVEGHYAGGGGIPISPLLSRLAFAIRLRDFNLLISSDITSKSKLIYIPDVRTLVQKALPFLSVDANPYPVVDNGRIKWVVDAYTTTSYFPYGEPAVTSALSPNSGLAGSYNYVRDAVKVVVDAYSGKITAYTLNAKADPLIQSYERAFPGLFQPRSAMDATLEAHLRYPQDLLTVQSSMYGRYHLNSAQDFYSLSAAWELSQTSNAPGGRPSSQLPLTASGSVARYAPIYQLLQLPGEQAPTFSLLEPFVPYSTNDNLQTLSALLVANSDSSDYGKLQAYITPNGSIHGPGLANADILNDPTISKQISLLDTGGSVVSLGTVQVLPIADSLLYVRPLYISSAQTPFYNLADVIVVYGSQIAMEPTLNAALADVFGSGASNTTPAGPNPGSSSSTGPNVAIPALVRQDIADAMKADAAAQKALAAGDLATYQANVNAASKLITEAGTLLAQTVPATSKLPTSKSASSSNSPGAKKTTAKPGTSASRSPAKSDASA